MKEIYGPYLCEDGRVRIVLRENKVTTTISYPKYLMEINLGRRLQEDEEVHHVDEDPANNSLDNLEIMNERSHKLLHIKRRDSELFVCPLCDKRFELDAYKLNKSAQNRKQGKKGPFCSKSCAGKASRSGEIGRHTSLKSLFP